MNKGGVRSAMAHRTQQGTLPCAKTHIWQDEAACIGTDPELFFAPEGVKANYNKANRICAGCPVWRECLQFALDSDSQYGMFGGSTPEERRDIKHGKTDLADFGPGHGSMKGTVAGFAREKRAGLRPCLACTDASNQADYGRKADRRAREE